MKRFNLLFLTGQALFLLMIPAGTFAQININSLLGRAKVLLNEKKFYESETLLDSVLAADSTDVNAYIYLSLCYRTLSDYQMASDVLTKALIYSPGNIKLMVALGNDLIASGRLRDSENILSQAFKLDSSNNLLLLSLGKVLMKRHNWSGALNIYNRLIRFDSSKSCFYEQAGKCRILLGDFDNAIMDLQVAHGLNPLNESTIMELSNLYYSKKQFISAMHIVDDGLRFYPSSSGIRTRKGDIYLGMKKYFLALENYNYSLNLGDTSLTNYRNGGICYYFTEKYDSAVIFLKKAIRINRKDAASFFYLGASYKGLENYNAAIKNLSAALKLLKSSFISEVYTQLASSYYSMGDYKKALGFYKDALKEKPKNYELNFYLAAVYELLYKDKSVAVRYYKKFLADSVGADKKLVAYAKDRIDIITENNFMKNKR